MSTKADRQQLPEAVKSFFERSKIPLTLADVTLPDQPIILTNKPFCNLTGYERSDIVGHNCRFLQGEATEQSARQELRAAIDGGRDAQVVLTNYRKSGEAFRNFVIVYALRDPQYGSRYFLGSQFDMSVPAGAAAFDRHIGALDEGVARIMHDSTRIQIKTRQLLSEVAVRYVMTRLVGR